MSKLPILNYKPEIDCLRAIAVFLVILFHFELFMVKGGFIGVDIFFVISGYLITNLIIKDIKENKFSSIEFYTRRLRRIIPALYSTILVVLIISYFILSPDHFNRVSNSSISAVGAYSNFFFWHESGYFDFDKFFKPFLHTWSLSVELQFYLIWPILIFIIIKLFRNKLIIFVLLIFLSTLFLSIIFSGRAPGYFYFTLFRLFEFSIGSLVYLLKDNIKIKANDLLFFVGIVLIMFSSFGFSAKSVFPGINALVPCFGAALILITGGKLIFFKRIFINNVLIYLGKISYSLYLVHWPLIIFYRYIKLEPLQNLEKILLIFVTIIISILSYNYIELPFRKKNKNSFLISTKKMMLIFVLTLITIILSSKFMASNNKLFDLSINKQQTIKQLKEDAKFISKFEDEATNRVITGNYFKAINKPIKVLIWGDSHGTDLYGTLKLNDQFANLDLELLDFDFFYCFKHNSFYDGFIQIIREKLTNSKKNICDKKIRTFNLGYEILKKADVIILSSRWGKGMDFNKIREFVKKYTTKKIIVVGRKPHFFHIPTLYIKAKDDLNYLAYLNRDKEIININEEIKKQSKNNGFIFYDLGSLICTDKNCKVIDKNNLLMSDEDHWSYQGFIYYGKMMFDNGFLDIILKNKN